MGWDSGWDGESESDSSFALRPGYWAYDWVDSFKKLVSIDESSGLITVGADRAWINESAGAERLLGTALREGGEAGAAAARAAASSGYPAKVDARVLAVNAYCELDQPGGFASDGSAQSFCSIPISLIASCDGCRRVLCR
eukprot:SAG31_NODE_15298_length_762_cov_0.702866_1_plen_140_part_00